MKRKILLGVIFSISILMLVNTSSAIEFRTASDYNKYIIESQLENLNNFIEKLRQTLSRIKINSINEISKNEIKDLSNQLEDLKISILNNNTIPTFILRILRFILSLLFSIIGTIIGIIFGRIFGPLLALLVRILTFPAVLLARIIAFIVNIGDT
jgi:hypothetical protein